MSETRLRMLAPLDGSPEAETILPALMPLFRTQKVRLTLLGVAPREESAPSLETYFHRLRTSLLLDGVASESKVGWGEPADEILWFARSNRFDLIAMTTHGRAGLRRAVAGSVTENVLRHSTVPVLACRPETKVGEWNRILVPLDGSPAAEAVLPDAFHLAQTTGARLHLLWVKNLTTVLATAYGLPLQVPDVDVRPYLDGIVIKLSGQGILTLSEVRHGDEAAEITACAREAGAGLICMSTHGRTGLPRFFEGSVAENVLRSAPCPVLIRRTRMSDVPQIASP